MPNVLIVEDNPIDLKVAEGLLAQGRNFTLRSAHDGEEALAAMRVAVPDIVVTDLVMPKLDGIALVEAVAKEFPRVPIVLVTGQGSEETAVQALRAGASSYVPKSQLPAILLETVEKLLAFAREQQTQQRLLGLLVRSNVEFHLENDLSLVPALINYLVRALRNTGYDDEAGVIRVSVALEEALNNAIFHGNLELHSDIRMLPQDEYRRQIEERRTGEPYCGRRVVVSGHFTRRICEICIRDEGPGFDHTQLADPTDPANLERLAGRGILLMRTFMDEVNFSPKGNEVTLVKYLA